MEEKVFKLTKEEAKTELWMRLSKEINRRIEAERKRNDFDHNFIQTTKIREKISTYKVILSFADEDQTIM